MPISEDQLVGVLLRERVRLVAFIRIHVGDAHIADDIFQEVSIQAVQSRSDIDDEAHLNHWLRRVARHRAIDHVRRSGTQPQRLDDQLLEQMEARWERFDTIASSDLTEALSLCMGKLTDRARRIVEMRYAEDLPSRVIADRLGQKVESVYKSITRAHRALGDCVSEQLESGKADHDG